MGSAPHLDHVDPFPLLDVVKEVPGRFLITVFCLLGLVTTASAKPRSTQADTVLDACKWAAEVQILKAAGKGQPAMLRVQVTDDKTRIYYGQKPGRQLSVAPPEASHDSAMADLAQLAGKEERLLMVVNEDDRIEFVGKPSGKKKVSYLLRTWYDFNAWWIFSTDRSFGTTVKNASLPLQTLRVSAAEVRTRLKKR